MGDIKSPLTLINFVFKSYQMTCTIAEYASALVVIVIYVVPFGSSMLEE